MKACKIAVVFLLVLVIAAALYNHFPSEPLADKTIDKIIVHKSKRRMEAYSGSELLKTYKISLGSDPKGHKQFEGDGKTPEGNYRINLKNPKSQYHLSLGVSYPNKEDKKNAVKAGRSAGGDIMIHGLKYGAIGKLHLISDWTQGCIAVTNDEIEELYKNVEVGTVIEILP